VQVAVLVGGDLELVDHHPGSAIHCGQGVAALVGVRTDHDH